MPGRSGPRQVEWRHVKAHTGRTDFASRWNDAVDRLAAAALHAPPLDGPPEN